MAGDPLRTAPAGKGSAPPPAGSSGALLTWTARPAAAYRIHTCLAAFLAAAGAVVVLYRSFGPAGLVLALPLGAVLAVLWLAPVRYTLTREGVRMESWLHQDFRPWSEFSAYRELPRSVLLLYRRHGLGGGWQTGLHLPAPSGTAEIAAVVARFLPRAESHPGGRGAAQEPLPLRPLPAAELAEQVGRNGRARAGQVLKSAAWSLEEEGSGLLEKEGARARAMARV